MKYMLRIAFVLTISVLISSHLTAAELTSYKAEVTAVRKGTIDLKVKGEINFNISKSKDWSLALTTKGATVRLSERSTGDFDGINFRPLTYRKRSSVLLFKENITWAFNWANSSVIGRVKKKSYSHSLPEIIHDPLSYQLPFRQQIQKGLKEFQFTYLRYSKPEILKFQIVGHERLNTETGSIDTLIIKQMSPTKKNTVKKIWVSVDYDHIPVKFSTYYKGKLKNEVSVTKLWVEGERISFKD